MKNRSRDEIYANILAAAGDGARQTEIMYEGFIEWALLRKYLSELTASGMLESDSKQIFKTTEKGLEFVRLHRQMGKYLSDAQPRSLMPPVA